MKPDDMVMRVDWDPDIMVLRSGLQVCLTITADGRLIPGPGLSMDEATQKAAQMLVEQFKKHMQS
jgi:hypothetical protein